jgi:betaine-homocysteine S-methyltransferase
LALISCYNHPVAIFSKKTMPQHKKGLLERLQEGPVICAEGYMFEAERRGYLQFGDSVPEVILEHPEVVEQLHREFVRAGSDVVLAFMYYTHREKLKAIGREQDLEQMNRKSLEIAKKVADETGTLLAGGICNTWVYDPDNHEETSKQIAQMYDEQVSWAVEYGVDFMIAETIEYLGEMREAVRAIKKHNIPAVASFAALHDDKTLDGVPWMEALKEIKKEGADVVGFNCNRGPETILPLLKKARKHIDGYLAAVPVPYQTDKNKPVMQHFTRKDGESSYMVDFDEYLCGRYEIGDFAEEAKKLDIRFVGICCGNAPHFTRALAEGLGRTTEASKYSPNMARNTYGMDRVKKATETGKD